MKTLALCSYLVIALSGVATQAQTIDSISVSKNVSYVKTSGGAPTLDPGSPYQFSFDVQGTDLSGIAAPVVTLAPGSTYPAVAPINNNNGIEVYNGADGQWEYGKNGADIHLNNLANMNAFFASGTYSVSVLNETVSLDLASSVPPNAPDFTFSQGSWINGELEFDPSKPLTITSNIFTGYADAGIGAHLAMELDSSTSTIFKTDSVSRLDVPGLTDDESADFASYTIAANTLTAGSEYFGGAGYDIATDFTNQGDTLEFAAVGSQTRFTLLAVNAPDGLSTLALLGPLALALAAKRRKVE